MISFTAVLARVPRLDAETLHFWVAEQWVRPVQQGGQAMFQEIDVARLQLILDLRESLEMEESAIPVVLSLVDQLYETRRQMRRLCQILDEAAADETAQDIVRRLSGIARQF